MPIKSLFPDSRIFPVIPLHISSIPEMREFVILMSWLMILCAIIVFLILKFGTVAGYGRYTNTSRMGLPPFLAWFLQEAPSFFIPFFYMFKSHNFCGLFLNLLFIIHYFNRWAETGWFSWRINSRAFIFPCRLRSNTVSPWYIMLSAIAFCCYNGFIQGSWNALYQECDDSPLYYIFGIFRNIVLIQRNQTFRNCDFLCRNVHQQTSRRHFAQLKKAWRDRIQDSERIPLRVHLLPQLFWRNHRMVRLRNCSSQSSSTCFCHFHHVQHWTESFPPPRVVHWEVPGVPEEPQGADPIPFVII